ncbi:hypothetical protein Purlil1_1970 [Purpureocillium lilacinum]|uniref:Uncharacterized protein n=3 Tax=Purpureocillium lilacinum TaxID=33203 RepID=A0ABR0CC55_PURLI|nr:hypothetical protein Purlil1_1970 [Purpureocillium lilacinum]
MLAIKPPAAGSEQARASGWAQVPPQPRGSTVPVGFVADAARHRCGQHTTAHHPGIHPSTLPYPGHARPNPITAAPHQRGSSASRLHSKRLASMARFLTFDFVVFINKGRRRRRTAPSAPVARPHGYTAPSEYPVALGATQESAIMGSSASLFKTLLVPAVISLIIFLFLTFVLVPVWRRYRNRYSQYLPLDSISDRTSSFRHRILGRFSSLNPLAHFVSGRQQVVFASGGAGTGAESGADDEDGEELGDVDEATWRAIERHVPSVHTPDSTRRLSRDLEEGFMDDSDDEPDRRLA